MKADVPQLVTVLELSASFHDLWAELADDYAFDVVFVESVDALNGSSAALVLAAGGEEPAALDLLLDIGPLPLPVYIVGSAESHRFGVEAIRRGGTDYFALPADLPLLRRTLEARVAAAADPGGSEGVPDVGRAFDALLGESAALVATKVRAQRIVPHDDVSLLISGETGTGKEVLARAIHAGGPRAKGPFIAVNCAAIPDNLLESELFGYEKGAFTGAGDSKPGLFEEADGGTIFLDEIGHLPLMLQGKLLRVLEEKCVRRVGGNRTRELNVRVISASHVDLDAAVEEGGFRDDLFYRLNVVRLILPPLRDRDDDIDLLADEFVRTLAERYQLEPPTLTDECRDVLRGYHWPGNVRELRHAIERALLLSPPGSIEPNELIEHRRLGGDSTAGEPRTLKEIMRAAAFAAVRREAGNKSSAARRLGISRARLQRLLASAGDET